MQRRERSGCAHGGVRAIVHTFRSRIDRLGSTRRINRAPVSQSGSRRGLRWNRPRPTKAARLTGASASFFPRLKIALSPCASPSLSRLGRPGAVRACRGPPVTTRAPQLWTRFNLDVPQNVAIRSRSVGSISGRLALNGGYGLGDPRSSELLRRTPSLRLLQSLELRKLVDLSDASVQIVASQCPALASLNVYSYQLTCASLVALARGCPNLRRLNIGCCKGITSLAPLTSGCFKLEELSCMFIDSLNDGSLLAISRGHPSLTMLRVDGCDIRDAGIQAIASGCPKLEHISLDDQFSSITDAALEALGAGCPALISLSAYYCERISNRGAKAILDGCPAFKRFNLQGSKGVSLEPIAAYVTEYALQHHHESLLSANEHSDDSDADEP